MVDDTPTSEAVPDWVTEEFVAELSEPCQDILDRFFTRDQSYKTIADELEIPSGTIASRIARCLGRLRNELEGRNNEPGGSRE